MRRPIVRQAGIALWLLAAGLLSAQSATADTPIRVAVASNFAETASALERLFESGGTGDIEFSAASTGKHYAQITNGAPFDVLLAADSERPRRLEETGLAVAGSRFTYATGRLVLWSRDPALDADECRNALSEDRRGRVALANPDTAPYGEAARQALVALGLWASIRPRLVYGENVAQTLQFIATGNARLGFVAAAQLVDSDLPATSCLWPVPAGLHAPIEQQAVLLERARDNPTARAFLDFLKSTQAANAIREHGYGTVDGG